MSKYYVLNENTLVYKQDGSPLYGVLAGKLQLGGHDWMNGPVSIGNLDTLRTATLEDFEYFRIDPKGYLT